MGLWLLDLSGLQIEIKVLVLLKNSDVCETAWEFGSGFFVCVVKYT